MDKLTELSELQARVAKLAEEIKPSALDRMNDIVEEINALAEEGKQLANASGLEFDLRGLTFLPWSIEGLSYRPSEGRFADWESSSAHC